MTPAQKVHEKLQIICWWCGLAFVVLLGVGFFLLMGFFPPPSPQLSAAELFAKYRDHLTAIKTGIIVCIFATVVGIPWYVMNGIQIARMEKGRLPVLSIISLMTGLTNCVFFILPFFFWAAAFYRADRAPELVMLLNDWSWLEFVMLPMPLVIQMACVTCAGFISTAKVEVLPRWFLFLNLWVAALITPGMVALYFFDGPFAWNGLFGIWIPFAVFGVWWSMALPVFYKAIKSHKLEVES